MLFFFFFPLVLQRPSERARCDLNVDAGAHILCAVRLVLATEKWLLFVGMRRVFLFSFFFPILDRVLARVARCPTDDIFRADAYIVSVCLLVEDRLLQISGGFQRSGFFEYAKRALSAVLMCFCSDRGKLAFHSSAGGDLHG